MSFNLIDNWHSTNFNCTPDFSIRSKRNKFLNSKECSQTSKKQEIILSIKKERKEEREEKGERNKNKEQKRKKKRSGGERRGEETRETEEMVFILKALRSSWYISSVRIELQTHVSEIFSVSIIRHTDSDDGGRENRSPKRWSATQF
jgi:hypothetical protein